jgi:hypothetical protein
MANLQYLGSGSLGSYTGYTRVQYNNNYNGSITIEKISGYKSGGNQDTQSTGGTVHLRRYDGDTVVQDFSYSLTYGNKSVYWGKNYSEGD